MLDCGGIRNFGTAACSNCRGRKLQRNNARQTVTPPVIKANRRSTSLSADDHFTNFHCWRRYRPEKCRHFRWLDIIEYVQISAIVLPEQEMSISISTHKPTTPLE
jgi:hypothetical protein